LANILVAHPPETAVGTPTHPPGLAVGQGNYPLPHPPRPAVGGRPILELGQTRAPNYSPPSANPRPAQHPFVSARCVMTGPRIY
jgi:hypothetical protein